MKRSFKKFFSDISLEHFEYEGARSMISYGLFLIAFLLIPGSSLLVLALPGFSACVKHVRFSVYPSSSK